MFVKESRSVAQNTVWDILGAAWVNVQIEQEMSLKKNTRSIFLTKYRFYEGWNFNSGNYLFTTDTK